MIELLNLSCVCLLFTDFLSPVKRSASFSTLVLALVSVALGIREFFWRTGSTWVGLLTARHTVRVSNPKHKVSIVHVYSIVVPRVYNNFRVVTHRNTKQDRKRSRSWIDFDGTFKLGKGWMDVGTRVLVLLTLSFMTNEWSLFLLAWPSLTEM